MASDRHPLNEPGGKSNIVGNFFESVAHAMLGGELARNDDGDICLWRTSTTVEVKSSGTQSSYGFRLSLEQIEDYRRRLSFPFNRAWYTFFAYENRSLKHGDGGRRTELSLCTNVEDINAFLVEKVRWCLLIDFSIVERLRDVLPTSERSILGHAGAQTVDIPCKRAYGFTNGALRQELENLTLQPAAFSTLYGRVKLRLSLDLFNTDFLVKFPFTAVLPNDSVRSAQHMLRRRGFLLHREAV